MTTLDIRESLRAASDLSAREFRAERQRTVAATAIERYWLDAAGMRAFRDDETIVAAAEAGQLVPVQAGDGYATIQRLRHWTPERSDPDHPYHYSAPYLRPVAAGLLGVICREWAHDFTAGSDYKLSITSLVRSVHYQAGMSRKQRKLTIRPEEGESSHLHGIAFDIDGSGLYRSGENNELEHVNPRMSVDYEGESEDIVASRAVLKRILGRYTERGIINYVEELPGTADHCFHVCVRPC